MLYVLDHADGSYTRENPQMTQCAIQNVGTGGDGATAHGIETGDWLPPPHIDDIGLRLIEGKVPQFWKPVEDWLID